MRMTGTSNSRQNAKTLRREMTPPEIALWRALRKNDDGLRFRKQHPAGDYVLDFYCAPARLAIEVDGEVHGRGDRPARDVVRDAWLAAQGVTVVRYPAREVLSELDSVVRQIVAVAVARRDTIANGSRTSPSVTLRVPPPPGGGG